VQRAFAPDQCPVQTLGSSHGAAGNPAGPALSADHLQVDQSVYLTDGFTATGDDGTIRLIGARIGGDLWLDTDHIRQATPGRGALVDLDGTTCTGLPKREQ